MLKLQSGSTTRTKTTWHQLFAHFILDKEFRKSREKIKPKQVPKTLAWILML